ncbi:Adaptive-response sensory-kinase SasA, partial [termite gut metagenome]
MASRSSLYVLCVVSTVTLFSCIETAPTKEIQLIDSLNEQAYDYRYRDLDSSFHFASQAYKAAKFHRVGKAEACNNMAFCAFMRMDFDKAEELHKEVQNLTGHELERLISDIGLMKIYQQTAENKEFYDRRNSAVQRMRRISEDKTLFIDKHEKKRLCYAYTEFFIVSAIYHYHLRQYPEALASLNAINPNDMQDADTTQQLFYHYVKGASSLCEGNTQDIRTLNEFDELYTVQNMSSRCQYPYFEGIGLQGLADLLIDHFTLFHTRRLHAIKQFGLPTDSLLPLHLAQKALSLFRKYNDIYRIADTYVTVGKYLNMHGQYAEALDTLTKALDYVNLHHQSYYANGRDSLDILQPYIAHDSAYVEVNWLGRKDVKTAPEWIARIREQLSVSYAGLEMKVPSDYNRNIYLDILDYTRQDKELENRYLSLQQESKQLNIVLWSVVGGIVLLVVLLSISNNSAQTRNQKHIARLKRILDICGKITASIHVNVATKEEMIHSVLTVVSLDIEELFQTRSHLHILDTENPSVSLELIADRRLTKEEQAQLQIIIPYIAWALENGMALISLGEEQRNLEKQRYVYEQRISRNKRENLVKKACFAIVTDINPYIGRLRNEINKLTEKGFAKDCIIKKEKYQYIDDLITTINEYNDILALWIKMKQGVLNLNIENFALDELFQLVAKGRRTFEMKQQTFEVVPTKAIVKADKALTFFMINTLTENARKYTPEEGSIRLYADITEEYAEISVEDTGYGLSAVDVESIIGRKIYDSDSIGMQDTSHAEALKKNKGSGFGLMNCKGIIETYRKTNKLFNVCIFNVESTPGKGSRFYFRLPTGIHKFLGVICCLLSLSLFSCEKQQPDRTNMPVTTDLVTMTSEALYETLLNEASAFADTAYFSNVAGNYALALQYADSAINRLNLHYQEYAPPPHTYMCLTDDESPVELEWWHSTFNTDFHVILDIRNEAAVAFLALKQWEAYNYNNIAYTTLYKLLGEDQSLEGYCRQLEASTSNKTAGIVLCSLLIVSFFIGYYILFVHKRLTDRWNPEQVLEINKKVYSSSLVHLRDEFVDVSEREEKTLKEIPRQIVNETFDAVNELLSIESISISVFNKTSGKLEYASFPTREEIPDVVQCCFTQQMYVSDNIYQALPLFANMEEEHECVGVFCLEKQEGTRLETDRLLFELITRYVAIVVLNAIVRRAAKYRSIEAVHEENRRASWEADMLHVQNRVLDNCLSAIKHETIYYPNKIKQIIGRLNTLTLFETEEKECIESAAELIEYYKSIFIVLSSCAKRQLERVSFRRSTIPVSELFKHAEKYFNKAN